MAVTTSYSGNRRSNARAAAFAAKQKRQKVLVAVGLVLLLLVLVYEVPHTLKLMHGGSTSSTSSTLAPTAPTTQAPAAASTAASTKAAAAAWKAVRHLSPHDPFANSAAGASSAYGSVSVPSGLRDPFASSGGASSSSSSSSAGAASSVTTLPKTIVVGSPGAGRTAHTGWIVILASIPSGQGRATANAFAKKAAGRGVGSISILNSSNAKPLRGGYWVVYTGPFPTLAGVTKTAGHVHAVGYGTAYIRQLVVYGKS